MGMTAAIIYRILLFFCASVVDGLRRFTSYRRAPRDGLAVEVSRVDGLRRSTSYRRASRDGGGRSRHTVALRATGPRRARRDGMTRALRARGPLYLMSAVDVIPCRFAARGRAILL